ncbi:beta-defensin 118-like [Orycteropus afer afer]|uniref:Beta-defensin n=1 Tax=Orycteropus afer afer TaxID=1230840 RepID=A0A8B6ZCW2_ORYAF|nr:beta-defensin 118-like [Orycteropus afer afer]
MKFLFLALAVLLVLFQMFTVCRGRKSCWTKKRQCRKDCKHGEQLKVSCKNGNYCCIPNKTDSQPHRPTQGLTSKTQNLDDDIQAYIPDIPIIISGANKNLK